MVIYKILTQWEEYQQVVDLEVAVWGMDDAKEAVPANMLHATVENGAVLVGAYDAERLIGFAYGFPARENGDWWLWSHMAGVHPDYQGQGIGYALKQQQREWALAHGYTLMGWTFDPMQRGNAHFNLHQLGAFSYKYKTNVYGTMQDGINAGMQSDRVVAWWDLTAESPQKPHLTAYPDDLFLLRQAGESALITTPMMNDAPYYFVEIPYDLRHLKQTNIDLALTWQLALGEILKAAFSAGYTMVDFVRQQPHCWYILEKQHP